MLAYFGALDAQGEDHLYEAKVLILGEGSAGKTSLVRRLYYPDESLPTEDETTRRIDIHPQHFTCPNGTPFRLNVWDFGGQLIYHATHQFFLTQSSLYVLVDDTRTNHTSIRDEGFKYWFEVIRTFGGKSPILLFQNEKGGRSKQIDEAGIKAEFPKLLHTYRGDLNRPNAADALREAIEHHVQQLEHVGDPVPARWVDVRNAIEERAKTEPYLSLRDYLALYHEHVDPDEAEPDREKALMLSGYLHNLGVFLHYQEDRRLRNTVIIQNRWATDAVFRILDDEPIKTALGRFTETDCDRLWADTKYVDKHPELLALMEKFELCYKLADTQPDTWLVPQLLSPSAPGYTHGWDAPDDLVRSYAYTFLPHGLLSRLIVRMHRFVERPDLAWANGALFEQGGTELLARVEPSGDTITLRARGPERKALMCVIASALDALNASFKGLEGKVRTSVPCTCAECRASITPELFELRHLRFRRQKNKLTIECRRSFENVNVLELLDGLRLDALPGWARDTPYLDDALHDPDSPFGRDASFGRDARRHRPPPAPRTVKIFLASSEELRDERDALELHFRRKNDFLIDRGIRLQIVRWEHFLDAMSATRLQDEYNKHVRAADLFVSLFMTKTGTYTEEEFDAAHDTFQSTGAPLIYTYFKDAPTTMGTIDLEDLQSLRAFQAKLSKLGHFWTKYDSTAGLMLHFEGQLQRLEAEGRL
ncbi:MAG: COR domain-containing protein [Bacteroidota bacterium]